MEYVDYYKIMGLERGATQEEIKRTHRILARKYHPDVSKEPQAEEKFKELGEAYEVLKDPEKRAAYDRLSANYKAGQDFQAPPNWDSDYESRGGEFSDSDIHGFSDFFEELFGRQGHGSHESYGTPFNARGQDFHVKVEVDLQDAFHAATRSISLKSPQRDEQGQLREKNYTINVTIPKGIKEGQQIRLAGQGSPGVGEGVQGDLYMEVHFKPHPFYRVEGRDLYMQLPVTPWEVALGATVKAPTPNGTVDLKIPAGSNNGNKLRLKGRGIPGNPAGNIYMTLNVVMPPVESEQAKALFKEMEKSLAFNPRINMGV